VGARYRGIDNAAHVGGLIGGFLLGYVLSRPLAPDRNTRPWTKQWAAALGVCAGAATLLAYLLSTGALGPGYAHLPMHPAAQTNLAPPAVSAPKQAPAMGAVPSNATDPVLAAMVAQESAKLDAKPKTVVAPSDQSYEALIAIRRGDYATANQIAAEVLARSHLQRWRFYPFNDFMSSITRGGNDSVLLEHLREWIRRDPKSAIAYLIRAEYYKQAAWTARGEEVADRVPRRLMDLFTEDLERATADVKMSINLKPDIPWSYFLLMDVVSGNGNTRALESAFQIGIKAFPSYYELYRMRLYFLTPKWGGSVKAMYTFVDQYAGSSPDNSPLKLLYMYQYAYLLDAAAFDCRSLKNDSWQQCLDGEINGTVTPSLVDGTMTALKLYKVTDPVEFSTALWPVLGMIAAKGGSWPGVGALLQKAASIMGSDNRFIDEPGHNSYVLDDITARVWARIGNGANAEKKYLEALDDIEHTTFPEEQQKAAARAWIYDDLTRFAHDNAQFINIIVYHDAANAVGGNNHSSAPWEKCHAYYKLKHYVEAVTECTTLIEGNGNYPESQYTRARAYEGLQQWDAAMADFAPIADSANNWLRVGAAIEMSLILGSKKNDVAAELALLNRYPYLFDPDLQPPDDLAIAFNNRCHAYMKLGLLKQALDDCNTSLKYGRIPDAFQKQQELMKQLGIKAAT
jgi:tetratricopeptide (TPR) repeat protein